MTKLGTEENQESFWGIRSRAHSSTDRRPATTCPCKAHTEAQIAVASWHKAYTEAQMALASWRKAYMRSEERRVGKEWRSRLSGEGWANGLAKMKNAMVTGDGARVEVWHEQFV